MFTSKWFVAFAAILGVGFGLVNSQDNPPIKAPPAKEEKSPPTPTQSSNQDPESKSVKGKTKTKLEQLQVKKLQAAERWLDGDELLTRYKLGKNTPDNYRDAVVSLTKAKLALATSNTERETILIAQKQLFADFKEFVAALHEAGSRGKQEVAEAEVYLLDAEIELEEFMLSLKEAKPSR